MTTLAAAPRTRPVARRLFVLGGVLAGGLTLSAVYATTGLGLPCPFLALTGWSCPLCGGTRMGSALLHGDVAAAWGANPAALIGVVVGVLLGLAWLAQLLGAPQMRWPASMGRVTIRLSVSAWSGIVAVAVIGYTVMRNLG